MSSRAAAFARFNGQESTGGDDAGAATAAGLRLAVGSIAHNPYNPREELQDIEDLADSLAARGLIQPVAVVTREAFLTAHPGHEQSIGGADFVVVDGNRRLAAATMAGLDDIPAHLDDSLAHDADALLETALVAAVHNKELEPIAQARVLEKLVTKYGSQRQVAKALHKSSGWVTQRLALLGLTPELQQAVEDKSLPVEVARQVGRLPQRQQHDAAQEALSARGATKKRRTTGGPLPEGAYAVSTRFAAGSTTDSTPTPDGAGRTAPAALRQELGRVPSMPWHDGKAVMDLALAELSPDERTRFLHRYIERSAGTQALLADLSRGVPAKERRQLSETLTQLAHALDAR
ncbi:ParB/RepB/Spo0J family partition protein [Streptomyces sp. NPDC101733]|uniref:ParB/RepB/Spo0J family partition protein n=1 Tax=unclassified Streptomyces TaxID=2593676 RepID=UPI00380C201A